MIDLKDAAPEPRPRRRVGSLEGRDKPMGAKMAKPWVLAAVGLLSIQVLAFAHNPTGAMMAMGSSACITLIAGIALSRFLFGDVGDNVFTVLITIVIVVLTTWFGTMLLTPLLYVLFGG